MKKRKRDLIVFWLLSFLILTATSGYSQTWYNLSPANTPRFEGMSTMVNGKIYVFSGFTSNELKITNTVEIYDPAANSWRYITTIPRGVTHTSAVPHGNDVWITGGFEGDHPGRAVNIVQIYNVSSNSWRSGPALPVVMAAHASVLIGNKLHVIGGLAADRKTDMGHHYALDLNNTGAGWVKQPDLPLARNHMPGISFGGKIYIIGGQHGHDGVNTDVKYVHSFDPISKTWTRLADLPTARSHHEPGTFVLDGKILVVGGTKENNEIVNFITEYNPATNTWASVGTLPEKILAPVSRVYNDRLIVACGQTGPRGVIKDTRYKTQTRSADKLGFYPASISGNASAGTAVKKTAYLFTHFNRVNFSVNSSQLPAWLKVYPASTTTGTESTELIIEMNSSGLAQGTYNANIVISASGYSSVTLPVNFQVGAGGTTNFPPTVSAGSDRYITLPTNYTTLYGSASDPDGIASYSWTKISGPSATMSGATSATLKLSNLVAGTYLFRLTAKDNKGLSGYDEAKVTVNSSSSSGNTVVSLTLINADTDKDIRTMANGEVINFSQLGTRNLSIRANTNPSVVGSVKFNLDGTVTLENTAPYAIKGDVNGTDYKPWTPSTGSHRLVVTPYTSSNGAGTAGNSITISFSVVENSTSSMAAGTGISETNYRASSREPFGNEEGTEDVFEIYPNPVESRMTIKFKIREEQSPAIDIYNLNGEKIKQISCAENNNASQDIEVDCAEIPEGLYIIRYQSGSKVINKKIFVKK